MDIIIILFALFFLMFVAYKGFSVILFAPIAALIAVFLTDPSHVLPFFSGIFMERMVNFIKLYFPVFLLGAVFGKLIEMSSFAKSITVAVIRIFGTSKAMVTVVLVAAILTYGGVSLFVVAFALYPFAAELYRSADIPKRLIPATIALGAFTFTMDALPGSPQIQNIIPTTFFKTDTWAAPWLGLIGGVFLFTAGCLYLEWRRRVALRKGEGYGQNHINEPIINADEKYPSAMVAIIPLLLVGIFNKLFTKMIPEYYGTKFDFLPIGIKDAAPLDISKITGLWAIEIALIIGILSVLILGFRNIKSNISIGLNASIGGALLATLNTGSEYGFGAIIAALPGFHAVQVGVSSAIKDPLLNEALTTNSLAAITGSASGGMSISLAIMGDKYMADADRLGISHEVLHRVASMASGGMDTLPHNGAIITLLAITGLTHKNAYADIFAMTFFKTVAVFLIIAVYYLTGIV